MENLKAKLIDLFKAETRASYCELDELIADEFTEIGGSGVRFGKKEALERLPSESPPKISASEYELRHLAPNCAQLLYKAVMVKVVRQPLFTHYDVQYGL
ncbi:nuclear transport factor 2 family protein [Shewanella baltica]|uniref:nuclear transport factor 2 family protein n=1 Tax=Shewanella baltica TaxID=62322 RepID=UPI00217E0191|nr:nuclear transport factor 2 family protein [Shewanella baltica]